jgi:hypothetical protein
VRFFFKKVFLSAIVNFPNYLIFKLAYSQFIIVFLPFLTQLQYKNNNSMNQTKYIFVTGVTSFRKGIIAASLAKLLQARGYRTTIQKFDPYLNVDPGTLNPYEHGECYVTDDGAETDLDLGTMNVSLNVPTFKQIMLLQEEFIFGY